MLCVPRKERNVALPFGGLLDETFEVGASLSRCREVVPRRLHGFSALEVEGLEVGELVGCKIEPKVLFDPGDDFFGCDVV